MIYYVLSIFVFLMFVAALIGFILFLCVLIDIFTIWWDDRRIRSGQVSELCACGCGRKVPRGWDGYHGR